MATAKPKSTKSPPAALARLYRPGVLERGLKIIAKEQDEAAAKKDAPAPDRPIGSITASAPDPIFDLIEAHRKAWARIVDAHENLEGALSKEAFTFEIKARGSKVDNAKARMNCSKHHRVRS